MKARAVCKQLGRICVDSALAHRGPEALERYLLLVKKGTRGSTRLALKAGRALANLPSARESVVRIKTCGVEFDYVSSPIDDLHFSSRDDFRNWEPISRAFFTLVSAESRNVVDCGAYTGIYTLLATMASPHVVVWAFEPNPRMFSLAKANIERNLLRDRVHLSAVALSVNEGNARLYLHDRAGFTSLASLRGRDEDVSVDIETRRLDSVLFDEQGIDLVKIDVEGMEANVLLGALDILKRSQPIIITEALSTAELSSQAEILVPIGYGAPIQVAPSGGDARNFIWVGTHANERTAHDLLQLARSQNPT